MNTVEFIIFVIAELQYFCFHCWVVSVVSLSVWCRPPEQTSDCCCHADIVPPGIPWGRAAWPAADSPELEEQELGWEQGQPQMEPGAEQTWPGTDTGQQSEMRQGVNEIIRGWCFQTYHKLHGWDVDLCDAYKDNWANTRDPTIFIAAEIEN